MGIFFTTLTRTLIKEYRVNKEQGFARPQQGLTLLEMMVVLALAGIIFGLAVPSAIDMIERNRMTAQLNYMSSVLQYTRFHAVNNHIAASLCPSDDLYTCDIDNWNLPKIVFADHNHNDKRDVDEPLLHATSAIPKQIIIHGPKRIVRFYEDGSMGTPASLLFCPKRPKQSLNRALFVSLQGRVRPSKDSNGDQVHERGNGKMLNCPIA